MCNRDISIRYCYHAQVLIHSSYITQCTNVREERYV